MPRIQPSSPFAIPPGVGVRWAETPRPITGDDETELLPPPVALYPGVLLFPSPSLFPRG